jgi:predicted enzyme related to lactoylglutathione lyase
MDWRREVKAKLVHLEVPTDEGVKDSVLEFYASLFGTPLARSFTDVVESYHLPIGRDGTWLSVHVRSGEATAEQTVCHFAVDDLAAAVAELTAAGGTLVDSDVESKVADSASDHYKASLEVRDPDGAAKYDGSFFKLAYVRDPGGNLVGLMEVADSASVWFDLDALPTEAQMEGHRRTLTAGARFASGEALT